MKYCKIYEFYNRPTTKNYVYLEKFKMNLYYIDYEKILYRLW